MNSNRNAWSKQETTILLQNIKLHSVNEGCRKASKQLGRTESACLNRWERIKPISGKFGITTFPLKSNAKSTTLPFVNIQAKPKQTILQDNMKVTYHNGVTKPMEIIAKTSTLVVAKADDVVVTIQL